jgi:hypothetical protein
VAAAGVVTVAEQDPTQVPPDGGVRVAVLLIAAGGWLATTALRVNVTLLPAGSVEIVSLIPPVPDAAGQTAPPLAAQVHVALTRPTGRGSARRVFGAATEPGFSKMIVYSIVLFGRYSVAVVVFVTETTGAAEIATVSEQLPTHVPPLGGVIVAVFVTTAGGAEVATAAIVYVSTPPAGSVAIVSFSAPVPDAAGQIAPPEPTHVHDWLAMPAGRGSLRTVFGAATEPLLVTVTTKLTGPFGTTSVVVVLFSTETLAPAGKATLLLHGGVDPPEQTPPAGGVAVATFVTVAGGVALTAALI